MISGSVVDDVDYVLPIEPKTYMEIPNLTHEEAIGLYALQFSPNRIGGSNKNRIGEIC